jgi:16S rRNA (cytidine1402-2'-O)-methyltransferase
VSGSLVLVATPLGNLGDISRRALDVLRDADIIYCEDTRHSRQLLAAHEIAASGRLRALHEHNEASLCDEVVTRVRHGDCVALVTDAGTPGISDPGSRVVAAVAAAGLTVTTTPGPSAVIGALSVSGLATERFVMEGFVPRKAGERAAWYEQWRHEPRTVVFYESPQRIARTLHEIADALSDRSVVVVRELTKMYEEVVRGTAAEVAATFAARETRGEIVVILSGAPTAPVSDDNAVKRALIDELARGTSTRDAATAVATSLGVSHRRAYELALAARHDRPE